MSRARPTVLFAEINPVALAPVRAIGPERRRLRNSVEAGPLDWDTAVHAARVLLDEMFGPPGSMDNPAMTDMAQELAARLCAYDEILDAVEHMQSQLLAAPGYSTSLDVQ